MSEGLQRAEIRSIPPKSVLFAAMLAVLMLLSGCSGSDQASESRPGGTASEAPASTPSVVGPTPSAAGGAADSSSVAGDDQPEGATPTLNEDDFADVISSRAGEPVEDVAGDVITAYGVHRLPESLIEQLSDRDLFGNAEAAFASGLSPAIVDLGMCAAGVDGGASAVEFSLFGDESAVYDERPSVFMNHAIAHPAFELPDPGECARGWLLVLHETSSPTAVRYVVSKRASGGELERYLYQWSVPFDQVVAEPTAEEAGVDPLDQMAIGEVVNFNHGPLTGTTVDFKGWAELIGAETPIAETRMVGVLAKVCTATEDWPELGLGIEGWNLLGPIDPADRLGADTFAPLAGSCFEDWIEFAVPFGAQPTSFFVADGVDPVNGFAEWTLAEAAIAPPDLPS